MGYSIWLNFGEQSAGSLRSKIRCIARRYSCPEFQPHLTLVGDMELGLDEVREVADIFAQGAMPSEITVNDVGSSDHYFMALFLTVDISSELQNMRELAAHLANPKYYKLDDPHVSMAYGKLDPCALGKEKKALKPEFLEKKLSVRDISIVQSSKSVPISEWKPVETINLNQTVSVRLL